MVRGGFFFFFFLDALGLHCCAWAFSSCGEWGLLLVAVRGLLAVVAFSCCGARALGTRASVVAARRLSSCGSRALECRLSSCGTQASRTRARTRVPCIGRRILNHCATREAPRGGFDLPEFTHWRVMPYSQMPFIGSLICVKESLVSLKRIGPENKSRLKSIWPRGQCSKKGRGGEQLNCKGIWEEDDLGSGARLLLSVLHLSAFSIGTSGRIIWGQYV